MEAKPRKTHLDALRILACLFVLYNHAAGQTMQFGEGAGGALALGLLYYSKPSIPLFLMVTGAVMLGRCDSWSKTLHRFVRMLAVLVLFSAFYYITNAFFDGGTIGVGDFFDRLYHSNVTVSLWYLYAYLGLLVMMPVLQRMSMGLGKAEYRWAIFWTLLMTGLIPMLQSVYPALTPDSGIDLTLFSGTLGAALMGYAMDHFAERRPVYTVTAVVVPVLIAAFETWMTLRRPEWFGLFDNSFLFPALFGGLCLFYLVKLLDGALPPTARVRAWISRIGKLTFCMYLVSDFVILRTQFVFDRLIPYFHTNGAGFVYALGVIVVCALLSAVLTRLPGLRKIL